MKKECIFNKIESDVRSYCRNFPQIFDKALGAEIWDINGNRYLDFLSGAGSLNYGHNNPVLKAALLEYIEKDSIAHGLDFHTKAKEKFLISFQDKILAPRNLDYVIQFTGPTGTNAVEAAVKIARKVTGRTNVISFTNGFHGMTLGSLALTGNKYHRNGSGIPLSGSTIMPYDGYFGEDINTIDYFTQLIDDPSSGVDLPAAVIIEIIQGEGGLRVARADWLKDLQALCNKKGILLIIDDIQAGCGRSGTFFSFESFGLKPDIITLSKSLSGYGLPFAITLIKPEHDVWKPAEHNGTFRGNNHAFVTASEAIENYWSIPDFMYEVSEKSKQLQNRLEIMKKQYADYIVEVRGRGLMQGLVFREPESAAKLVKMMFDRGLIIERSGPHDEVIKFMMPLTISFEQLEEGLDIFSGTLETFFENSMRKAS